MSEKSRQHKQLKRDQAPRTDSRSARERARAEAAVAARKSRDLKIIVGIAVTVVLLGLAGGVGYQLYRLFGGPSAEAAAGPEQVIGSLEGAQPIVYGADSAPKTVDIYLDFSCPACQAFDLQHGPGLKQMMEAGEIKIAYHPLSFLQRPGASVNAANAFACAAQRGYGQAYMMQLFVNQGLTWSDRQLIQLARDVGGEAAGDISGCVTRKQNEGWVDAVNDAPKPPDFQGTPGIYVGQTQIEWQAAMPPEELANAIRAA